MKYIESSPSELTTQQRTEVLGSAYRLAVWFANINDDVCVFSLGDIGNELGRAKPTIWRQMTILKNLNIIAATRSGRYGMTIRINRPVLHAWLGIERGASGETRANADDASSEPTSQEGEM
jgi:hypothetical protein